MNFMKKIFDGNCDEQVHQQFVKFSRGEFANRALIKVKNSSGKFTINTSAEFGNELVYCMAAKLGNKKTKVTGAIVSTLDLKSDIEFKEIKQFQGVKRYLIENEMAGSEIISLIERFPKAFFGLSFDVDENNKLKVKPKAPKSGKPGKGDEAPVADFCKLITDDISLAKSFIFEKSDFKKAELRHTLVIEDIVVSDELKKEKDFALVREKAKRKGKIIREGEIDGEKVKVVKEFEA